MRGEEREGKKKGMCEGWFDVKEGEYWREGSKWRKGYSEGKEKAVEGGTGKGVKEEWV